MHIISPHCVMDQVSTLVGLVTTNKQAPHLDQVLQHKFRKKIVFIDGLTSSVGDVPLWHVLLGGDTLAGA